jgi:type I restriction enzyme M protein
MAIKKSQLYSSIWKGCDELRGGMDASQYKDYVLVLFFVRYVSDKYAGKENALVDVPEGGSFADLVKLKGQPDIGEGFNKVLSKLAEANDLQGVIDAVNFNDEDKLGKGKDMQDRLSNLIAIFETSELDFSKNRAEGDDLLGDAYEYLMKHFAVDSGKSKGQFYTPAEVSRIMAKVIDADKSTGRMQTVYDPTCGSGSLLLKVAAESPKGISIFGQELDNSTAALAMLNMWLHNEPQAEIKKGQSSLSSPLFTEYSALKTFDYVVANPPFSYKAWSNGFDPEHDLYGRFDGFGIPPQKNGDYAFLLHIIKSLKSTGKGAVILPHGVLFRGNVESRIRTNLIERGYIKGIIGLPANLFYGTGIPACIIVLDKEGASERRGIFMIDASRGFIKDGNKNRLREMDIRKVVDTWHAQTEVSKYARFVENEEIQKNEYNLNIPRYIDTQEPEDIQDIEAHLRGGIPNADIEALSDYWEICPTLKATLFHDSTHAGYSELFINNDEIKKTVLSHKEFEAFREIVEKRFSTWRKRTTDYLKDISNTDHPKAIIGRIADDTLSDFGDIHLLNKYDIYQHLLTYWEEVMQDDAHIITADGWRADTYRIIETNKKGKEADKGWTCDLIPKTLVINRYFVEEQKVITNLKIKQENLESQLSELEEEHSNEDGALNNVSNKTDASIALSDYIDLAWSLINLDTFKNYKANTTKLEMEEVQLLELNEHYTIRNLKNNKGNVTLKAIKERLKKKIDTKEERLLNRYLKEDQSIKAIKKIIKELRENAIAVIDERIDGNADDEYLVEIAAVRQYLQLTQGIADTKKTIKDAEEELDAKLLYFYPTLTEDQIKQLVVDDKWMNELSEQILGEVDTLSQKLTGRVQELAERYSETMPDLEKEVEQFAGKVDDHLKNMGFIW